MTMLNAGKVASAPCGYPVTPDHARAGGWIASRRWLPIVTGVLSVRQAQGNQGDRG